MLLGSVLSGLGAYIFQAVVPRALGAEAYAPIGTLWTVQFLLLSVVLYSVETYVNKEVATGRGDLLPRRKIAVWIGGSAVTVTLVSWAARSRLFYGLGDLALVAGALVIGFGIYVLVRGQVAGVVRFRAYGLLTATESLSRLVVAVPAALLLGTSRVIAWTLPLGPLIAASWWPLLRRRGGGEVPPPSDAPSSATVRFLAITTAANAMTQTLLAGGPLLLAALAAPPAEVSVFFVTITAARIPVVIALGGLLSRVLPTFTRMAGSPDIGALRTAVIRIGALTASAAVVSGLAAAALGPSLVAFFFGREFTPPWWLAAGAITGVLLATGSMIINQALIGQSREHRLLVPWLAAVVAAGVTVAIATGSLTWRVTSGFVVGEVVAFTGLMLSALAPGAPLHEPQPLPLVEP